MVKNPDLFEKDYYLLWYENMGAATTIVAFNRHERPVSMAGQCLNFELV